MTAATLELDRVEKRFGRRDVLDGVTMTAHGGLLAVLGPNGAGKTTLLRCLSTVIPIDAGRVVVDGLDAGREGERIEIRRRLGYLPQHVGLIDGSTAFDAVDYLAVLKGIGDERRRRALVFDVLDRVGLRDRATERVERLSGGMRRRLGLAQALIGRPGLLVLDEPGAGLDPDERLRLREILTERRGTTTIVVATHLTDEAAICDRVLVLSGRTIRFSGSPERLAAIATGRAWVQRELPPPDVRASWRLADGTHRCLGHAPPGATLVPPTLEDGYLLVESAERS